MIDPHAAPSTYKRSGMNLNAPEEAPEADNTCGSRKDWLEKIQKAEQLGHNWQGNIADLKMVIEVYMALGADTNTLISLYERGLELVPNDVQLWGNIADAYASMGEREKAKAAAEKLLELRPDLKEQIEQFLRELGY